MLSSRVVARSAALTLVLAALGPQTPLLAGGNSPGIAYASSSTSKAPPPGPLYSVSPAGPTVPAVARASATATDVNARGQAVGYLSGTGYSRGFVAQSSKYEQVSPLHGFASFEPLAINDKGSVAAAACSDLAC